MTTQPTCCESTGSTDYPRSPEQTLEALLALADEPESVREARRRASEALLMLRRGPQGDRPDWACELGLALGDTYSAALADAVYTEQALASGTWRPTHLVFHGRCPCGDPVMRTEDGALVKPHEHVMEVPADLHEDLCASGMGLVPIEPGTDAAELTWRATWADALRCLRPKPEPVTASA